MSERILIAYASRHGATAEVAEVISQTLSTNGVKVDLASMTDIESIDGYRAVVVGAPIYSANWMPEATEFVKKHQAALGRVPVACFVLAIRLRDDSDDIREAVKRAISTERVIMQPVALGLFAGALDYGKLSPIVRLQAETKKLPEGDFRDWDAIRDWASTLPDLL
jgi:menaquinone-dependent protoporphyrinogen oxidase